MEKRLLHGGDYNPDQWLKYPNILADDIQFMKDVQANAFSVGIFAWAALEPAEGQYEFGWLDERMDSIAGIGGKVILATPSGARPAWMSQKYPEVLRTGPRGEKMMHGGRHNHCYSSPIFREKIGILNEKLARRYKDHPALYMWHISNEYSGECYCPLCQENFREWVQKKYGTLNAVNDAYWNAFWSHTYTDFSQIEPPMHIGETAVHTLNLDWRRFITDMTIDFYQHEIAPLRNITPNVPITTNFMSEMPPPHPFAGLDYGRFAPHIDVISWDAYPPWHNDYETTEFLGSKLAFLNDYYRALKNKPFLILESTPSQVNWQPVNKPKRPGMHILSSLACVAHGADAIMYFQWRKSRGSSEKLHGAVVDHDNSPNNRVFKDVAALGDVLTRISEVKDTSTPAKVALVWDVENFWALEDAQGFTNSGKKYPQTLHAHYRAFWKANIPVDVITKDKLNAPDLARYDLVVAPMLYMTGEATMAAFKAYVTGGGTLVSSYIMGLVDENDLMHLGGFPQPLKDIFGISINETDTLYPTDRNQLHVSGAVYEAFDYCALFDVCGAEVLGTYGADFYAGNAAVTKHTCGKGAAYFIGARTGEDFLEDFYLKGLGLAYNTPPITAGGAGVSIQTRESESHAYYFVLNFTEGENSVVLEKAMMDVVSGEAVPAGKVNLPVYGARVFKVSTK